jgi:hypothetical protein
VVKIGVLWIDHAPANQSRKRAICRELILETRSAAGQQFELLTAFSDAEHLIYVLVCAMLGDTETLRCMIKVLSADKSPCGLVLSHPSSADQARGDAVPLNAWGVDVV